MLILFSGYYYLEHSFGVSYPSAEKQSVYSTAPAYWEYIALTINTQYGFKYSYLICIQLYRFAYFK